MLILFLMSSVIPFLSSIITPPGEAAAMDAYVQGRLNLVYIGEPFPVGYRDLETGILLESLGCVLDERKEQYRDEWNDYMLNIWVCLGSDSTYFVVRSETESLEYYEGALVYRDSWGSVPVEIFPEDLSALSEVARYSLRDAFEDIVYLEMYTPLWEDTLRTEIPLHSPVVTLLLDKGRREIQRNQIVE
ncbi:MAG: hypothetical protein KAH54_12150 [Candidatus Sabulitectum sp.]|nr:hypothetical protein [Candidatus Sabulitectum sp.]